MRDREVCEGIIVKWRLYGKVDLHSRPFYILYNEDRKYNVFVGKMNKL